MPTEKEEKERKDRLLQSDYEAKRQKADAKNQKIPKKSKPSFFRRLKNFFTNLLSNDPKNAGPLGMFLQFVLSVFGGKAKSDTPKKEHLIEKSVQVARQMVHDAKKEEEDVEQFLETASEDPNINRPQFAPMFVAVEKMRQSAQETAKHAENAVSAIIDIASKVGLKLN